MGTIYISQAAAASTPITPKTIRLEADGEIRPVKGRPIKFDQPAVTADFRGKNGELIVPILYESQCPFCGYKLQFAGNLRACRCTHCNRGEDQLDIDPFTDPFYIDFGQALALVRPISAPIPETIELSDFENADSEDIEYFRKKLCSQSNQVVIEDELREP